jgi:hypothetical protein
MQEVGRDQTSACTEETPDIPGIAILKGGYMLQGMPNRGTCVEKPPKDTIARLLMSQLGMLEKRVAELADRAHNQLACVAIPENASDVGKPGIEPDYYPPLFDEIRGCIRRINTAVGSIEDLLSRTEL